MTPRGTVVLPNLGIVDIGGGIYQDKNQAFFEALAAAGRVTLVESPRGIEEVQVGKMRIPFMGGRLGKLRIPFKRFCLVLELCEDIGVIYLRTNWRVSVKRMRTRYRLNRSRIINQLFAEVVVGQNFAIVLGRSKRLIGGRVLIPDLAQLGLVWQVPAPLSGNRGWGIQDVFIIFNEGEYPPAMGFPSGHWPSDVEKPSTPEELYQFLVRAGIPAKKALNKIWPRELIPA